MLHPPDSMCVTVLEPLMQLIGCRFVLSCPKQITNWHSTTVFSTVTPKPPSKDIYLELSQAASRFIR